MQAKATSQHTNAVRAIRIAILSRVLPNFSANVSPPAMEAAQILKGSPLWL
jgi:hypothetical protein